MWHIYLYWLTALISWLFFAFLFLRFPPITFTCAIIPIKSANFANSAVLSKRRALHGFGFSKFSFSFLGRLRGDFFPLHSLSAMYEVRILDFVISLFKFFLFMVSKNSPRPFFFAHAIITRGVKFTIMHFCTNAGCNTVDPFSEFLLLMAPSFCFLLLLLPSPFYEGGVERRLRSSAPSSEEAHAYLILQTSEKARLIAIIRQAYRVALDLRCATAAHKIPSLGVHITWEDLEEAHYSAPLRPLQLTLKFPRNGYNKPRSSTSNTLGPYSYPSGQCRTARDGLRRIRDRVVQNSR